MHRRISAALESSSKVTKTLAELPVFQDWRKPPDRQAKDYLAGVFLTVMRNFKIYDQIRFLDCSGREVLRADRQSGPPVLTPEKELQNKSDRYYFKIGIELGPSEEFISPLDLNVERGKVEIPWKPTVRFVRPVFDGNGRRIGVMIVNYLAEGLLHELTLSLPELATAMLVDRRGYWLLGAKPEFLFGFAFPERREYRMQKTHPKAWAIMQAKDQGQVFTRAGLITFSKFEPQGQLPAKPTWTLISLVPAGEVDRLVGVYLHSMMLLWAALSAGAGIGAWLLARNQTRRRLAEELAERNAQHQAALKNLLAISLEGGDLKRQLQEALAIVLSIPWLSILPRGAVFLTDPRETRTLRLTAIKDLDPALLSICARVPFGRCHCGRAAQSGELQYSSHLDSHHENTYPGIQPHGHYCLPIMGGGQCQGVMVLYLLEGQVRRAEDASFWEAVAKILASIIEANRSAQELAESEARLKAVVNNAVEGIVTIDAQGTIESFNPSAEKIFGYSAREVIGQSVSLLQPPEVAARHQEYVERYLAGGEARVIGIGREAMGRKKDGTYFPLYLSVGEVTRGGLTTFTGILRDITQLKRYEAELTKAKEAAEMTSRELLDKQARLDEDLEAAAGIQRALLPARLPQRSEIEMAWHFQPSQHIGGDIFEAFLLDRDHLLLYMVDVSGHGVPSALVTVSVHDMLELHSGNVIDSDGRIMPPAQVLELLDRQYPLERFGKHFTITYIVLNLASGRLVYANAGHPPPVLLRKKRELEYLEAGGSIIGLDMGLSFEQGEAKLRPGDKLLLYTDGVLEYQNAQEDMFGQDRLTGLLADSFHLSLGGILEALRRGMGEFGHGAPPADDVSLLALKYRGPAGE